MTTTAAPQVITVKDGIAAGMTLRQIDDHNWQVTQHAAMDHARQTTPRLRTWTSPRGEVRRYINNVEEITGFADKGAWVGADGEIHTSLRGDFRARLVACIEAHATTADTPQRRTASAMTGQDAAQQLDGADLADWLTKAMDRGDLI